MSGPEWKRVTGMRSQQRGGILAMATMLACFNVREFPDDKYLMIATRKGIVKKDRIEETPAEFPAVQQGRPCQSQLDSAGNRLS